MATDTLASTDDPDAIFHALVAEPRRELLLLLAQGDASVSELAVSFEISRPAISKHLKVLKDAGLVESRQEGRRNVYRLDSEPLQEITAWLLSLDSMWSDHLDDIDGLLDEPE